MAVLVCLTLLAIVQIVAAMTAYSLSKEPELANVGSVIPHGVRVMSSTGTQPEFAFQDPADLESQRDHDFSNTNNEFGSATPGPSFVSGGLMPVYDPATGTFGGGGGGFAPPPYAQQQAPQFAAFPPQHAQVRAPVGF